MRKRKGFSLIDVLLATVVLTIGTLGIGKFVNVVYDQLAPSGPTSGLRRYLLGEEMLRAQAEGLRALQNIPPTAGDCKLVTEPPGMGYMLSVQRLDGPLVPTAQQYNWNVSISQDGQTIGTISLSTVRAIGTLGGLDAKIGL
jgi:hypothetical protein